MAQNYRIAARINMMNIILVFPLKTENQNKK